MSSTESGPGDLGSALRTRGTDPAALDPLLAGHDLAWAQSHAEAYPPALVSHEQHQELLDRYRLLVELSPDAIVVHERGIIRYANGAAGTLAGMPSATMVGRAITAYIDPSEIADTLERIQSLTEPGMVSGPVQATLVTNGGARLIVDSTSVRTTWENRPAFQVIMRDVSARDLATRTLRAHLRLASSISDAIVTRDADRNTTGWNRGAEDLFGWTADEAMCQDVFDHAFSAEDRAAIRTVFYAEGQWSGDVTIRRKDGRTVPVHVALAAVEDGSGRLGSIVVCSDLSARHAAAAAKAEAEYHFTTVVSALDEGIVVIDEDGLVRSSNPAAARIFGCTTERLEALFGDGAAFAACDPDGLPLRSDQWPVQVALAADVPVLRHVVGIIRGEDERVWLHMNVHPLHRPGVEGPRSYVCSFSDNSELHRHSAELAWAAEHDDLTGLLNRHAVSARFHDAIERNPLRTAALFCNLDGFKEINDRLGYHVGDEVLREVAATLLRMTRSDDVVSRLNSDEFLILCTNASVEDSRRLAERVVFELGQPLRVKIGGEMIAVTLGASIGLAHTGAPTMREGDVGELLQAADVAMHQAKALGRRRVEEFDGTLRDAARRRLDLRDDLRAALEASALEVHYQPIWRTHVDPTQCTVAGFEALVRWTHPTLGRQNPQEFVAVAEDTGLISQLGMYVLTRACLQTMAWRNQGHDVYISVNLSARQLSDPGLVPSVASTLFRSGLPPTALWLELTESALAEERVDTAAVLQDLRDIGVRISIDDFGTGYSSLGRLRHTPAAALKVDQSFVADMTRASAPDGRGDDGTIVASTVSLAHRLGLVAIAEGVETIDQHAALAALGCDYLQGYLLGRPVPAMEVSFTPNL